MTFWSGKVNKKGVANIFNGMIYFYRMMQMAIFASGSGTNAENLIRYFAAHHSLKAALVLTNNARAGVIDRTAKLNVPCKVFSKQQFLDGEEILNCLGAHQIDFIVLAGYLLLVPEKILSHYHDRIINIHPALLPAHGGKGFYGSNVHEAVIQTKSIMSGITIHKVNSKFDEGEIIFQAACHVSKDETAESLAVKIHELEYTYFPVVTEKYFRAFEFSLNKK
jgi:phosphoribosylglycinamide formyltransferase-1